MSNIHRKDFNLITIWISTIEGMQINKEKRLIITIVLLNMVFGYLFQLSNGIVCFTELTIISLSGTIFWLLLLHPIRKIFQPILMPTVLKWQNLFVLSGAGVLAILLNLLFVQVAVIAVMSGVFGCISPAFNTLNASLTNNIAGNLLCYSALIGSIFHDNWQQIQITSTLQKNNFTVPAPSKSVLWVNQGKVKISLALDDIVKIQSSNNCIYIFTTSRKFVKYQSLKSILAELPTQSFKRIHRNTIVNLSFIKQITSNKNGDGTIELQNQEKLKFSRTYRKNIY